MVKSDNTLNQRLNQLLSNLTPRERQSVLSFAEFLAQRNAPQASASAGREKIAFDGWAGCLSHVDKSAVELQHEAMAYWTADEADRAKGPTTPGSAGSLAP